MTRDEHIYEAYTELACLFPEPQNALFQNALAIVCGKNEADAACILKALHHLQAALHDRQARTD